MSNLFDTKKTYDKDDLNSNTKNLKQLHEKIIMSQK